MKESIIILGKLNKKFLLPFILALIQIIYNIFNKYYPENNYCGICELYSIVLGKIYVRLFPFILKISNNETNVVKNSKKKKWLLYFLLFFFQTVLILIYNIGESIVYNFIDKTKSFKHIILPINDFITLSFETIFLVGISILLLKYKYYKHHIISMIIFMIFGIISDISFNNYENIDQKFFLFHFIKTIEIAMESLFFCYQKYMMEKFYCPYWNVSFFPGLSGFLILCIFLIIVLTDPDKEKSSVELIANFYLYFNGKNIGLKIGKIIISFILYIIIEPLIILILFYFRPDFILIVLQFAYISKNLIEKSVDKLYCIIFFIIQFLALMIHLEIFELNFCDLNENTRRNIDLRSKIDLSNEDMDSSADFYYIDIDKDYTIDISEKNEKSIEIGEQEEIPKIIH